MAHFIADGSATNLVELGALASRTVDLWGGKQLDVLPSDPRLFDVSEIPASFGPDIRRFTLRPLVRGSGRLWARLGTGGPIWADARVVVDQGTLFRYYHGTNGQVADLLLDVDLTPMFLTLVAGALMVRFDWTDYTDFGKGFYVHLEENKVMAYEWAKRRFASDWAVVEFIATPDELGELWGTALHFRNKTDRPTKAPRGETVSVTVRSVELCPLPQLLPCIRATEREETRTPNAQAMNWLEFVEFNRHIDPRRALIARPNDRDWTHFYSRIRGPIWVPRDSGYNIGLPVFPDKVHQLNWGLAGMAVLNQPGVKIRRFKFSSQNEGLFPPPV
jgi:hypothetical protein